MRGESRAIHGCFTGRERQTQTHPERGWKTSSDFQIIKKVKTQCSWMIRSLIDEKKQGAHWMTMDEEDTLRRGRRRTTKQSFCAYRRRRRRHLPGGSSEYCSSICIARVWCIWRIPKPLVCRFTANERRDPLIFVCTKKIAAFCFYYGGFFGLIISFFLVVFVEFACCREVLLRELLMALCGDDESNCSIYKLPAEKEDWGIFAPGEMDLCTCWNLCWVLESVRRRREGGREGGKQAGRQRWTSSSLRKAL